jgi:hypothetical protein
MAIPLSQILKSAAGQTLPAMASVLAKASSQLAERKIAEEVLLGSRLYPDMFALTRQVQVATDMIARGAARLAGVDFLSLPDVETSFAELIARTEKVNAFIQGLPDDALNASEEAVLQIPMGPDTTMPMPGITYLLSFVFPNFYFHAATAYGILRHNGVALGKRDFLMAA